MLASKQQQNFRKVMAKDVCNDLYAPELTHPVGSLNSKDFHARFHYCFEACDVQSSSCYLAVTQDRGAVITGALLALRML